MNEVKKSLQSVAGNGSKDKEELKRRVLYQEHQPKRRNPFPLVATVVVMAALVFLTFNILQNGSPRTNGNPYEVNEELYNLLLQNEKLDQGDSPELRYEVFQSILEIDSVMDYAASLGYKEDRKEIEALVTEQQQSYFDDFTAEELEKLEQSQIDNFGYTYDQYFQVIYTFTSRFTAVMEWLQKNESTDETTQREVLDAFQEENQQVITDFMKKKSIPDLAEDFAAQTYDGIVASSENQQVLLVQGLEPNDYEGMSPEEMEAAAFDSVWFHIDRPFNGINPYEHIEITFDPLSYPIVQKDGDKTFQDVIKWIHYQE